MSGEAPWYASDSTRNVGHCRRRGCPLGMNVVGAPSSRQTSQPESLRHNHGVRSEDANIAAEAECGNDPCAPDWVTCDLSKCAIENISGEWTRMDDAVSEILRIVMNDGSARIHWNHHEFVAAAPPLLDLRNEERF